MQCLALFFQSNKIMKLDYFFYFSFPFFLEGGGGRGEVYSPKIGAYLYKFTVTIPVLISLVLTYITIVILTIIILPLLLLSSFLMKVIIIIILIITIIIVIMIVIIICCVVIIIIVAMYCYH